MFKKNVLIIFLLFFALAIFLSGCVKEQSKQVNETANWPTYQNNKYSFQVTLTDNWKNYKTKISQEINSEIIDFCVFAPNTKMQTEIPGYVCLFRIIATDKIQWDKDAEPCKKDLNSAMCDWIDSEIVRNDNYVFSYGFAQDFGDEEEIFFQDIENIISSFQIKTSAQNDVSQKIGDQEVLVKSEIKDEVEVKIINNKKENKYIVSVSGRTLDEFNYDEDLPEEFDNLIDFRFGGQNYLVIFYEPALTPGWEVVYNLDTLEKIKTELMRIYISNDGKYIISYGPMRIGTTGLVVETINNRGVKKWISEEEICGIEIKGDILEYKEFRLEDTDCGLVKSVDLSKL